MSENNGRCRYGILECHDRPGLIMLFLLLPVRQNFTSMCSFVQSFDSLVPYSLSLVVLAAWSLCLVGRKTHCTSCMMCITFSCTISLCRYGVVIASSKPATRWLKLVFCLVVVIQLYEYAWAKMIVHDGATLVRLNLFSSNSMSNNLPAFRLSHCRSSYFDFPRICVQNWGW